MATKKITVGTPDNKASADSLHVAFTKINSNFVDVENLIAGVAGLASPSFSGTVTAQALNITRTGDAVLTFESLASPTTTYRRKQIFSSPNVGGGNDWLFRMIRPSDNAVIDFQLQASAPGYIFTSGNFDPSTKATLGANANFGDIIAARAGGTSGALYLNSSKSAYVYYDGTNYTMPNGQLFVNGGQVWTNGTFDPSTKLNTSGGAISGSLSFGSTTRQMVNLYGTEYGMGVQDVTAYIRTGHEFAVHLSGVHTNTQGDPGTGGSNILRVSPNQFTYRGNTMWHSGNMPRADGAVAIAASSDVAMPSVLRIRSMIEAWGTIQAHWFGLRPNDASDKACDANSAAIQDAFNAIVNTRRGGILQAPEGTIYMGGYTPFGSSGATSFGIAGHGATTKFYVDGGRGSIGLGHFSSDSNDRHFTFRDFDIIFNGPIEGTLLSATGAYYGAVQTSQVRCTNVRVGPNPALINSGYFRGGLDFTGNWHADISNVYINTAYGPGAWEQFGDDSIRYKPVFMLCLNECYTPVINKLYIWGGAIGVQCESYYNYNSLGGNNGQYYRDVATQPEGFWMTDFQIVDCKNAFRWYRGGPAGPNREPQLNISRGHINYRDTGIHIEGAFQFDLERLLIYNYGKKASAGDAVDIYLRNVVAGNVSKVQHMDTANTGKRQGMFIDGTYMARQITIDSPQFGEVQMYNAGQRFNNGIWVYGANATDITVRNAKYHPGVFTSQVVFNDTGSANNVSVS